MNNTPDIRLVETDGMCTLILPTELEQQQQRQRQRRRRSIVLCCKIFTPPHTLITPLTEEELDTMYGFFMNLKNSWKEDIRLRRIYILMRAITGFILNKREAASLEQRRVTQIVQTLRTIRMCLTTWKTQQSIWYMCKWQRVACLYDRFTSIRLIQLTWQLCMILPQHMRRSLLL